MDHGQDEVFLKSSLPSSFTFIPWQMHCKTSTLNPLKRRKYGREFSLMPKRSINLAFEPSSKWAYFGVKKIGWEGNVADEQVIN